MLLTSFFMFFSSVAFGVDEVSIAEGYFSKTESGIHDEIPLFPSDQGIQKRKLQTLDLAKKELRLASRSIEISKKYSSDFISYGDCRGSLKKAKKKCRVLLVSKRNYDVVSSDVNAIVDMYTTDLRNPFDKTSIIQHVKIERNHWEITNNEAIKVSDEKQVCPMSENQEYTIKKCRNGAFVGWSCNDIHYHLYKLSSTAFLILGKQRSPAAYPKTFKIVNHDESNNKVMKEEKFTDKQCFNTADGTLTITFIKKQKGKPLILVREITLSSFSNPANARKIMFSKRAVEQGLMFEYNVLQEKFNTLRLPATHTINK